jgi:hypothetical protein
MIAIGAQTYANAEALRLMRRDCLSKHLLLEGRVMVSWHKGRAGREQRRSFLRDKSFSVPVLVEQVLAMTERLVPHAPQVDQGALFLTGMIAASRAIGVIPCYMASKLTRRFVERHGLVGDDGKLLKLTLATLRASGLTLAHERLGHDILKTQALANHATPDTTQRYVDRPPGPEGAGVGDRTVAGSVRRSGPRQCRQSAKIRNPPRPAQCNRSRLHLPRSPCGHCRGATQGPAVHGLAWLLHLPQCRDPARRGGAGSPAGDAGRTC